MTDKNETETVKKTRTPSATTVKVRAFAAAQRAKDKLEAAREAKTVAIQRAEDRIVKAQDELAAAREAYKAAAGEDCPI